MNNNMTLTFEKILKQEPCGIESNGNKGYSKGLKLAGKNFPLDKEFTLIDVLEKNGIMDAIWCLCCFDYKDYCRFNADVVKLVAHIPKSKLIYDCIDGIEDFYLGNKTKTELFFLKNELMAENYNLILKSANYYKSHAYHTYQQANYALSADIISSAFNTVIYCTEVIYEPSYKLKYNISLDIIETIFIKHFA